MELVNQLMQEEVWKMRWTGRIHDDDKGPPVLYGEFEKALEELKNKKAIGPDGKPVELLKVLGSDGKQSCTKFVIYTC